MLNHCWYASAISLIPKPVVRTGLLRYNIPDLRHTICCCLRKHVTTVAYVVLIKNEFRAPESCWLQSVPAQTTPGLWSYCGPLRLYTGGEATCNIDGYVYLTNDTKCWQLHWNTVCTSLTLLIWLCYTSDGPAWQGLMYAALETVAILTLVCWREGKAN